MTTVVLGWDGLDYELAERWNLLASFGAHHQEIATIENPVLGEPHTRELWPSIITGRHPAVHGIRAATESGGIEWDSAVLNRLSDVATGVVPQSVRERIGTYLRDRGHEVQQYGPAYYEDAGIRTVFDGRDSRPISVPNYRVDRDDAVDIGIDRTSIWRDVLRTRDRDGATVYEPLVSLDELEEHLLAKCHKRVGLVRAAMERHDLVFCWMGYLDTVGHLAPMVEDEDWKREQYREAASITRSIHREMDADDVLVCVSDHGLQQGHHTHSAFYGTDDERAVLGVESVLDVRATLERLTPMEGDSDDDVSLGTEGPAEDVEETLESLGYV